MKKTILALFLFLVCISQTSVAQERRAESKTVRAGVNSAKCDDKAGKSLVTCYQKLVQAHEVKLQSICETVSYWLDSDTKGQSEDALYEGLALLTFQSIYEIAECDTLNDKKTNAESDYWYGDD